MFTFLQFPVCNFTVSGWKFVVFDFSHEHESFLLYIIIAVVEFHSVFGSFFDGNPRRWQFFTIFGLKHFIKIHLSKRTDLR